MLHAVRGLNKNYRWERQEHKACLCIYNSLWKLSATCASWLKLLRTQGRSNIILQFWNEGLNLSMQLLSHWLARR